VIFIDVSVIASESGGDADSHRGLRQKEEKVLRRRVKLRLTQLATYTVNLQ
jgi:hypothetical protein